MRYAIRALLAAFLVGALIVGVGVAGGESPPPDVADSVAVGTDATPLQPSLQSTAIDDDQRQQIAAFDREPETEIRIDLQPNRDAHWEVTVRYELADANETAVFEDVSERYPEGELGPSETLFESFADGASRNADREMSIVDVERSVTIYDDVDEFDVDEDDVDAVGELRLTFVWTDFLETDGEDLVLGDALTTPTNETWLRSLSEDQSIEIATPDGYSVSGTPGATVSLRDNAVIIDGPRVFDEDERVAVVYSPTGTVATPPWTMLAAAIVLAALLIAIGLLGYRRFGAGRTDDDETPVPAADSGDGGDVGTAAGAAAAEEPAEDLSLLSDEERVERLLEREGGRMRQADIVSETGWSDAKVSQLLSTMADEGRVEKLRLGRENLISLPEEESTDNGDDS